MNFIIYIYFNLCMDRSNFPGDRQLNSDPRLSVCSDSLPVNKQTSPKAQLASTFALLPRSVSAMGNLMECPGCKTHSTLLANIGHTKATLEIWKHKYTWNWVQCAHWYSTNFAHAMNRYIFPLKLFKAAPENNRSTVVWEKKEQKKPILNVFLF